MDFEDEEETLVEFAEKVAEFHYSVAWHPNQTVSLCETLGGKIYGHSQNLLKAAIKAAYPESDEEYIYELWVDCGESIAYCVEYANRLKAEEEAEEDNLCNGHETLRGDMMGESYYCDGSCQMTEMEFHAG